MIQKSNKFLILINEKGKLVFKIHRMTSETEYSAVSHENMRLSVTDISLFIRCDCVVSILTRATVKSVMYISVESCSLSPWRNFRSILKPVSYVSSAGVQLRLLFEK